MWGDEQVLCLCSMMWQIRLTVVSAETFTQIRFRHRSSLEKADGVLVMCLGQHYVPVICAFSSVTNSSHHVYVHCVRMQSDAVGQFHTAVGWLYFAVGWMLLFLLINSILYLFQCVALMEWMHQAMSRLSLTV